jgi:hypothetical protein
MVFIIIKYDHVCQLISGTSSPYLITVCYKERESRKAVVERLDLMYYQGPL